jgi:hypothetical protein
MNPANNPAAWLSFFSAEVSASAALTGLVIVAISINLKALIENRALSGRAGETVVQLACVLILSSLGLVPGQPNWLLGAEFLMVGGLAVIGNSLIRWVAGRHPKEPPLIRNVIVHGASLPIVIAGASLIAGTGGGFYWLVPGVIFTFVGGVINTWVLLVEILR